MRKVTLFNAVFAASVGLVACTSDAPTLLSPTDASHSAGLASKLLINGLNNANLQLGKSDTLSGVVTDALGVLLPNIVVGWWSSNSAIATVSSSGVVTAKALGSVHISAFAGGGVGNAVVVNVVPVVTVTAVTVTPTSSVLAPGATTQATATARDAAGTAVSGQTITWTTASSSVATVSASGVITAVGVGTTTITATSGTLKATVAITVAASAPPPPPPPTAPFGTETLASLPTVYLNTTAPAAPAAGGKIINVSTAAAFQAALNSANYGDVIALANGATFIGNFVLPAKGANNGNWITIEPASMAGMPAAGARMTPTIAAAVHLPVILSPSNAGAIVTAPTSHHYRLIGLEVSQVSTVASNNGLIRLGEDGNNAQLTLASIPHDFVLDRMYLHGVGSVNTRRCVGLNSATSSVIDSYLSACHDNGSDAQAIAGWNGPGPYKIVNNYLEASGENIMFGGADPSVPGLTPSDIEIRGNHFFKPTSWKTAGWLVKNLFELKHAQRVLIEGNLFENNWTSGQAGTAIAMKTVNQGGTCTWCVTQDITFRYNLIRNVGGGFTISGSPDNSYADIPARRLTIINNIVYSINTSMFNGIGQGALLNGDVTDLVFAHNTIIDPTNAAVSFGGTTTQPMIRMSLRDNIIGGGVSGVKGSGTGAGTASLTVFAPGARFGGNVITLPSSVGYPTGNSYPTSLAAIAFSSYTAFDFHLLTSSSYRGKAMDGTDPGANVDAVMSAVVGVIVP